MGVLITFMYLLEGLYQRFQTEQTIAEKKSSFIPKSLPLNLFSLFCVCFFLPNLVISSTEQRINSRGSKSSNLIEKVNGWRSQRGGTSSSMRFGCI